MSGQAVIFDMDGVLVDSYRAHLHSWQALAREMGVEYTEADFVRTFGQTTHEILTSDWPVELSADEAHAYGERKEQIYRGLIRADFPEMPGASELMAQLRAHGFLLAIGSSGPRANIDAALDGFGVYPRFDAVASREDIERGKPDPEVFLVAAHRLCTPAASCAVIEDAPAGVEAATRAGMLAIGLTGTVDREGLRHADLVVERLAELGPQRIAEAIAQREAR